MGIAANFTEISSLLHVYVFLNGRWHRFEKNVNYEVFLFCGKNHDFTLQLMPNEIVFKKPISGSEN